MFLPHTCGEFCSAHTQWRLYRTHSEVCSAHTHHGGRPQHFQTHCGYDEREPCILSNEVQIMAWISSTYSKITTMRITAKGASTPAKYRDESGEFSMHTDQPSRRSKQATTEMEITRKSLLTQKDPISWRSEHASTTVKCRDHEKKTLNAEGPTIMTIKANRASMIDQPSAGAGVWAGGERSLLFGISLQSKHHHQISSLKGPYCLASHCKANIIIAACILMQMKER